MTRLKTAKCFTLLIFILLIGLVSFHAYAGEMLIEDVEKGLWEYSSEDLRIRIVRRTDERIPLIWYEAELFCSEVSPLLPVIRNPMSKGSSWLHSPETLARGNKLVFAVNDDYYGDRLYGKEVPGIIIRGGDLLAYETFPSGNKRFPNLDTMALLRDGSLYVFESKENTPTEYFEMGATDVFAFGPILLRNGNINPRLESEYLETEPRVGFGMVEKYHYVCVVAQGRSESSKGVSCQWLALKLKELGVVEALNMDGGQTAALVFMGNKINMTGVFNNRSRIRNISSMIGAGISQSVPDPE